LSRSGRSRVCNWARVLFQAQFLGVLRALFPSVIFFGTVRFKDPVQASDCASHAPRLSIHPGGDTEEEVLKKPAADQRSTDRGVAEPGKRDKRSESRRCRAGPPLHAVLDGQSRVELSFESGIAAEAHPFNPQFRTDRSVFAAYSNIYLRLAVFFGASDFLNCSREMLDKTLTSGFSRPLVAECLLTGKTCRTDCLGAISASELRCFVICFGLQCRRSEAFWRTQGASQLFGWPRRPRGCLGMAAVPGAGLLLR